MSKITDIKLLEIRTEIECDCGTKFEWYESTKADPNMNKDTCPNCGIKYGLVLAPKKIKINEEALKFFVEAWMIHPFSTQEDQDQ